MKTDLEKLVKTILFPFDSEDRKQDVIDKISQIANYSPELNMLNYSEDEVVILNNEMNEIRQILKIVRI
jgi:hypothetical protein